MPGPAPPESILGTSFDLGPGVEIEPQALAAILVDGGYERQDPVDEHGEFSVRGGILDVFPAGESAPIRIEFIGDSVESIRRFDPGTQRSIETLDQFQIVPVREPAGDAESRADAGPATLFDYLRASKPCRIALAEPADVQAQSEKGTDQIQPPNEERGPDKANPMVERRPPD